MTTANPGLPAGTTQEMIDGPAQPRLNWDWLLNHRPDKADEIMTEFVHDDIVQDRLRDNLEADPVALGMVMRGEWLKFRKSKLAGMESGLMEVLMEIPR